MDKVSAFLHIEDQGTYLHQNLKNKEGRFIPISPVFYNKSYLIQWAKLEGWIPLAWWQSPHNTHEFVKLS